MLKENKFNFILIIKQLPKILAERGNRTPNPKWRWIKQHPACVHGTLQDLSSKASQRSA